MPGLRVIVALSLCAAFALVLADESQETTSSTTKTTTENPKTDCALFNTSCGVCISKPSCMWCESKSSCLPYPGGVIPSSDVCPLNQLRWATCWVNYEALLIAIGVISGILLISVIICVCCCYRRCHQRCAARRERREEEISNAEFEERRERNNARRTERQVRYDEIRRKYGLPMNDSGSSSSMPYSRFDNEA